MQACELATNNILKLFTSRSLAAIFAAMDASSNTHGQDYYKQYADREEERLLKRCRIEFETTKRVIREHLPSGQPLKVLDIGGATGTYALWLEGLGYDVTLIDKAPSLIEIAQSKIDKLGSSVRASVGDAIDLSMLNDNEFDAAVSLGPQYHLVDPVDFRQSLNELKRIVKSGGLIFSAFLNKTGTLRWWWGNSPQAIYDHRTLFQTFIETGHFPLVDFTAFNNYIAFEPDAILERMESNGFSTVGLYNCEGLGRLNVENSTQEEIDTMVDFNYQFCRDEKYHALAEHLLYVGRTP